MRPENVARGIRNETPAHPADIPFDATHIVDSDSLLLLKPTAAVPHKGGERFTTNSLEYTILSQWIAAGTPGPKSDDPRIESLSILPETLSLQPGMTQAMDMALCRRRSPSFDKLCRELERRLQRQDPRA